MEIYVLLYLNPLFNVQFCSLKVLLLLTKFDEKNFFSLNKLYGTQEEMFIKKSPDLRFNRLIFFRLLRVSGAHLLGFALKVAVVMSRWQCVDLICSGFEPLSETLQQQFSSNRSLKKRIIFSR